MWSMRTKSAISDDLEYLSRLFRVSQTFFKCVFSYYTPLDHCRNLFAIADVHRRRDESAEFCRVGNVNWALSSAVTAAVTRIVQT